MATRTEVTCDRCGIVWMVEGAVGSRCWNFKFWNLCQDCDTKYLQLHQRRNKEMEAFFKHGTDPEDLHIDHRRTIKSPHREGTRSKEEIREAVQRTSPKRATATSIRKKTYHPEGHTA